MVSPDLSRTHPIEERRSLWDHDESAPPTLQDDVDAATRRINQAGSIACSRILADTRLVLAKLLADAELVSTRLTLVVEMAIPAHQRLSTDPLPGILEDLILDPWGVDGKKVSDSAEWSVETIKRDADTAMTSLTEIGLAVVEDIHNLAVAASLKAQVAAGFAAERLGYCRRPPASITATFSVSGKAAETVVDAADDVATILRQASDAAIRNILAAVDDACRRIQAVAKQAEHQIESTRDCALARIQEVATFI